MTLLAPRPRASGRALGAVRSRPVGRVVGAEHEFGVFEQGRQVDFRDHIHRLEIPGRALHPTNPHQYLTNRGSAIMADGIVAEIATPPIEVGRDVGRTVAAWADVCRVELADLIPCGLTLVGGSTHLSISVDPPINDRAAVLYARTFSAALMLLMDQAHSPGLLVRPRPGRLELCGEYLVGRSLAAACLFAIGSVLAVEERVRGRQHTIPPFVDVELEPGRRRYGWYVDRSAFGVDLYEEGRSAHLRLADGRSISAQGLLVVSWKLVRPRVADLAAPDDLEYIDRLVDGGEPLPLESGQFGQPTDSAVVSHPLGAATRSMRSPALEAEPRSATWDWVAWEMGHAEESVIALTPRGALADFERRFTRGGLDRALTAALSNRQSLPNLNHVSQTREAGVFASISEGPALLPEDRYGIGGAEVSAVRPGKRDLAPEPATGRWTSPGVLAGIAVVLAGLVTLALALAGVIGSAGDDQPGVFAPPATSDSAVGEPASPSSEAPASSSTSQAPSTESTPAPATEVAPDAPTVEFVCAVEPCQDPRAQVLGVRPVVLPGSELWLLLEFAQPWDGGPPDDLFSYFFALDLVVEGQPLFLGWETHDGAPVAYGSRPLYVLSNGTVLAATGYSPATDYSGEARIETGSWVDENTTQAVFDSFSFPINAQAAFEPELLAETSAVYDLLSQSPLAPTPLVVPWEGLATLFDGLPLVLPDADQATIRDPIGDLEDYYGLFDAARPDIESVGWWSIQVQDDLIGETVDTLASVCGEGLGLGVAVVCPEDLGEVVGEQMLFVDVMFTGDQAVFQTGIACADPGRPTYEGEAFDPNNGRNTSIEVFQEDPYAVGTTTFDGTFQSGPSNDLLAIVRTDGVALLTAESTLASCSDLIVFTVADGGVDVVEIPDRPAASYAVGTTTTTSSTSTTTTTTSSTTTVPAASAGTATAASDGGSPWVIPVVVGTLVAGAGVALLARRPETSVVTGFEKGTTA